MKKYVFRFFLCGLLSFSLLIILTASDKQQKNEDTGIQFNFAVVCKETDGKINIIDPNNDRITLSAGDQIRVFIQPVKNAYVYLYLYDAEKNQLLIFPDKCYMGDDYDFGKSFYIHEGLEWFSEWLSFDNSGLGDIGRFELVVSEKRLEGLEILTRKYFQVYFSSESSENDKAIAVKNVIDALVEIRKQRNEFISESIVQVPLGGAVRGEAIDATHIMTNSLYGKTINIGYQE
ncbi:MAG: DUF4384 domain-containing protein [Spirochaetales bacterium]|nr:DUF4384 domain-containing protein [Spirochaetales bacterium]